MATKVILDGMVIPGADTEYQFQAQSLVAGGTIGQVYTSNGLDAEPSWQDPKGDVTVTGYGDGNVVTGISANGNGLSVYRDITALSGITSSGNGNVVTDLAQSETGALIADKSITALSGITSSGNGNVVTSVKASDGTIGVSKDITAITGAKSTSDGKGNIVTSVKARSEYGVAYVDTYMGLGMDFDESTGTLAITTY